MISEKTISIAELRARHGRMTQKELADIIDVSQSTVSTWERNIHTINSKDLVKLCNYFNISADEILGLELNDTPVGRF